MYEKIDLDPHRYTYVLLRWATARETIYIYIDVNKEVCMNR